MSARWRRLGLAAGWSAVLTWIPMSILYTNAAQLANGGDFGMYYAAAETLRFAPHADLYSQRTLAATVLAHGGCGVYPLTPYPYQPLLAMLLEPVTFLPCLQAALIWTYVNYALWLGLAGVLSFLVWRRHGAASALAVAAIMVFFTPILSGIHLGQIHLILLILLLAGVALVERDHPHLGGAALGIGILLKYLPLVVVVYYLTRGRWKVAASAAVCSAALVLVEYLVVGPRMLLESVGAGASDVRFYATTHQNGHWLSALPGGAMIPYVAGAGFVGVVLWVTLRAGRRVASDVLGAFWAVNTLLLIFPLVWWFYLTWLMPSFLAVLATLFEWRAGATQARASRPPALFWLSLATLVASYLLMLYPAYDAGAVNYRLMAIGTALLWLLSGALYLRGAGVRWPGRMPGHAPSAGSGSA